MPKVLFLSGLVCYLALYCTKVTGIYIPFLSDYGADLLCLPIVLHITQLVLRYTGTVPPHFILNKAMILFATIYIAVVFELVLPNLSKSYTSDIFDVLAYFLGAFAYYRISRMEKPHMNNKLGWLTKMLFTAFIVLGTTGQAQDIDWSSLSAKEKAEIARKEQIDAARDNAFLRLMDEGHTLFEQHKYLKSIQAYEAAREMRPFNVYPPVIIRDIELSMKDTLEILREREKLAKNQRSTPESKEQLELPDREKEMESFREKESERQEQVDSWEENQRRALARERALKEREDQEKRDLLENQGREVSQTSMNEFQQDLAEQYSEGVTQRTYEEGKRKITERIVVKGDVGNEYKRVEHPWGGKFYFKNGSPISEDTWNTETNQ